MLFEFLSYLFSYYCYHIIIYFTVLSNMILHIHFSRDQDEEGIFRSSEYPFSRFFSFFSSYKYSRYFLWRIKRFKNVLCIHKNSLITLYFDEFSSFDLFLFFEVLNFESFCLILTILLRVYIGSISILLFVWTNTEDQIVQMVNL